MNIIKQKLGSIFNWCDSLANAAPLRLQHRLHSSALIVPACCRHCKRVGGRQKVFRAPHETSVRNADLVVLLKAWRLRGNIAVHRFEEMATAMANATHLRNPSATQGQGA
jgi:hypothetical protein